MWPFCFVDRKSYWQLFDIKSFTLLSEGSLAEAPPPLGFTASQDESGDQDLFPVERKAAHYFIPRKTSN